MLANEVLPTITRKIDKALFEDEGGLPLIASDRQKTPDFRKRLQTIIQEQTQSLEPHISQRIEAEYFSFGPIDTLIEDQETTEIMLHENHDIVFEKNGQLIYHRDQFYSQSGFYRTFQKLIENSNISVNQVHPFAQGRWRDFRIHVTVPPISKGPTLTMRRIRNKVLPLKSWQEQKALSQKTCEFLERIISEKKNLIIFGNTGCGKTTMLNSLLGTVPIHQRIIALEDSDEIILPNKASLKLQTRSSLHRPQHNIGLQDLVFESLRMRPDRLVLGEIRGGEAKDLLLALATGHSGSVTTMHSDDIKQVLLRLEMLVQLGAPQWPIEAIRQLIHLSVDYLVHMRREGDKRKVISIHRVTAVEKFGFLTERLDDLF